MCSVYPASRHPASASRLTPSPSPQPLHLHTFILPRSPSVQGHSRGARPVRSAHPEHTAPTSLLALTPAGTLTTPSPPTGPARAQPPIRTSSVWTSPTRTSRFTLVTTVSPMEVSGAGAIRHSASSPLDLPRVSVLPVMLIHHMTLRHAKLRGPASSVLSVA